MADQPGIVRRQKRRKKEREASADVRRLWYLTFGVMLSWHYGVASGHWGESGGFVACGCASPSSEELLVGMLWAVCCFAVGERWSAVVSGHFGVLSAGMSRYLQSWSWGKYSAGILLWCRTDVL